MEQKVVNRIREVIADHGRDVRRVADFIFQHPEVGYHEHQSAACLVDFLRSQGWEVTAPASSIPTSFCAVSGNGKPEIAIIAEFDALPEIGHACGHNLIAAAAIAAGTAAREMLQEQALPGTIKIIGTPAEEGAGGKLVMLREGVFKNTDYALICHPFPETLADQGALAVSRFDVKFQGLAAHAAAAPHKGKNALDAMMLLFNGISAWRQQFPPHGMVHGVITQGGNVPNIIPEHTAAFFYIRAADRKTHQEMEERFARIVQGAAMMTDTGFTIDKHENPYQPILVNRSLNRFFTATAPTFDLYPAEQNVYGLVSTDFGDVSQQVPGANWFFKVCDNGAPLHSEDFKAAAATDHAFDQAMKMAGTMAATAVELLTNADFRQAVTADFKTSGH